MKNTNRKIIVTFKPQLVPNAQTQEMESYTRPPFETTEANLDHVKRIHGKIFKEARFADDNTPIASKTDVKVEIVEKVVEKTVEVGLSDETMIKALAAKGKSANSIARTLEIKIEEVEKILNKNLTVA